MRAKRIKGADTFTYKNSFNPHNNAMSDYPLYLTEEGTEKDR